MPNIILSVSEEKAFLGRPKVHNRALVGVGAMGAMAPTLFENMSFGTDTFGKNLIDLSKLTGINQ